MITENEYISILNTIPKLFINDYSKYVSSIDELLKTETLTKKKSGTDRFYQFPLSEQFFCYLKNGLENSQNTFNARYKQIANSKEYNKFLKTPLLLIFTNSKFLSATKKTPELYFDVYKEIIASNTKAISEFKSIDFSVSTKKSLSKNINDIIINHNMESNDLVYIIFYLRPVGLLIAVNQLIDVRNPHMDGLFGSDLNSHYVDGLLKLKNTISFNIIEKIIKNYKASAINYLKNFQFENGVSALAWFKAFMFFNKNISPEEYAKNFKNFVNLRLEFLTYDIYSPKIKSMFPNLEKSVVPLEVSSQVSAVSLEREQINQTMLPFSFFDSCRDTFQSTNSTTISDEKFLKRKLLDSTTDCVSSEISISEDQYETTSSAYSDSTESKKHKNEAETVQEIDCNQAIKFTLDTFLNPNFFHFEFNPEIDAASDSGLSLTSDSIKNEVTIESSPSKSSGTVTEDTGSKTLFDLSPLFSATGMRKDESLGNSNSVNHFKK